MIIQSEGGSKRRKNDFYPTDPLCAVQTLLHLPHNCLPPKPLLFDVGAGTGVYGTAARAIWPDAIIWGVELVDSPKWWQREFGVTPDYAAYDLVIFGDFTEIDQDLADLGIDDTGVDLVMGNPPYYLAEEAVKFGMRLLRMGGWMGFLYREAFAASETRFKSLFTRRPYAPVGELTLVNRPSFFTSDLGSTTDNYEYAWEIWHKDPDWSLPTQKGQLDWKRQWTPDLFGMTFNPATLVLDTLEKFSVLSPAFRLTA